MKSTKKVALGMSGGVDSSVCAHLLQEQGYEVTGVFLECWRAPGCRTDQDRKDALKVALSLDIPFQVLDFKQTYKEKVVDFFIQQYKAGYTPNPDVLCNQEIKFGLFYDWAMTEGFDNVATGHYASIQSIKVDNQNKPVLTIPTDTHKDQTYFLYLLAGEQLNHTLFPLAALQKTEVRQLAVKYGLHNAQKKDSVGICFIGDINVGHFLEERLGENPGEVINSAGQIIGQHRGLWFYTIGQRHGFQVDKKTVITLDDGNTIEKENIPPFYVIGKDPAKNQLIVGFGAETYQDTLCCHQLHWIDPTVLDFAISQPKPAISVRIRHTGQLVDCSLDLSEPNLAKVSLAEPIKGIAEGQAAVFYAEIPDNTTTTNNTICLGGGRIT